MLARLSSKTVLVVWVLRLTAFTGSGPVICMCVFVCMCVCVYEREREREKERMYVCVCVYVRVCVSVYRCLLSTFPPAGAVDRKRVA